MVGTTAACLIANITEKAFNNSVTRGFYAQPPEARRGTARDFDPDQLIRLYFYARLLEDGHSEQQAGSRAYHLWLMFAGHPEITRIEIIRCAGGFVEQQGFEGERIVAVRVLRDAPKGDIIYRISFDIATARNTINQHLAALAHQQ